MTEGRAIAIAAFAHLLLLGALSLGLARQQPQRDMADVTPIDFIEVGAVATVTTPPAPPPEAAPREPGAPAPAEVSPLPAETPPPPRPTETSIARQVADTAAQDAIAAEVAAPPPPRSRPAPAPPVRREFDPGQMAALIDKSLPEGPRSPRPAATRDGRPGPEAPVSAIQMATLQQAIRAQIAPCWNPPVGGADVAEMTAVLAIRLNRDGSVAAPPRLVSQTGATDGNAAYARAFVEAARRAVLRCAPLQLPADLYRYWGEFELNFDPKLMT